MARCAPAEPAAIQSAGDPGGAVCGVLNMAMTWKRKYSLVTLVCCLLLLSLVRQPWSGWGLVRAPVLQMQTLDGERIDLAALRGKPVLVSFWHSYCSSCMREMPHLAAWYRELAPAGLRMVGVAMSYDDLTRVQLLRAKRQIPYPVVFDRAGEVARAFGQIQATPMTFLIAPDGTVARNQVGPMSEETRRQVHAQIVDMLSAG